MKPQLDLLVKKTRKLMKTLGPITLLIVTLAAGAENYTFASDILRETTRCQNAAKNQNIPSNTLQSAENMLCDLVGTSICEPRLDPATFPHNESFDEDWPAREPSIYTDSFLLQEDFSELVIGLDTSHPESCSNITDLIASVGGRIVNKISIDRSVIALVAKLPTTMLSSFTKKARDSGLSQYLEPRMKFQAQSVPNDPYWSIQWGPHKIQADLAWDVTTGNSSILVAVIDTGINYYHPDLESNYAANGRDWVNNGEDPMDDNGHGTHCAGIIAAVLNNSIGIAGLAQVKIMAEKGLDYTGSGFDDDLANAIIHAVDQGAKILSNSWGGDSDSHLIHDAIRYAYAHDVLVVAAAGNQASSAKTYPAAYKEVIAVTATDRNDDPASFTSFGDWVELAAPGVGIYSTIFDSYGYMSGTSMACPHVVGVGALVWSQFPAATRDWVRARLRFTADDLGEPDFDQYYGFGRINAWKAVAQTAPAHDLLIFDWELPKYVQPRDYVSIGVTVLNSGLDDENNVTVQLLVQDNLVDSAIAGDMMKGTLKTVTLNWTPLEEGTFNLTLYVLPVLGETAVENNKVTKMIPVRIRLALDSTADPVGTKVTVSGRDFLSDSQVVLMFNDVPLGLATADEYGNFTFTFNIPISTAGTQIVKAQDAEGNYVSSTFTVIDDSPLDVRIDVGTLYFIGEIAEFYVLTTFQGQAVNANTTDAMLYKPSGSTEKLVVQPVATGLYKIPYTLTDNNTGTYTLVIVASYMTNVIRAEDTSFKCFSVSNTLALMKDQVVETRDGIAVVQTDMSLIRLNLTAMNTTLENVFLNVISINETTATIQTTLGRMDGTITSVNDNIATILVPGIGQIKADISEIKSPQGAWSISQYAILSATLVAAVAAILSLALLRRKGKAMEPTPSLQ